MNNSSLIQSHRSRLRARQFNFTNRCFDMPATPPSRIRIVVAGAHFALNSCRSTLVAAAYQLSLSSSSELEVVSVKIAELMILVDLLR